MKPVCVVLFAVVAAVPVLAHHAGAGFSQETKVITGTVKQFQFMNPHSWIQVNVTDETGKMVEWSLEWNSPNELGRQGIRPSTFPAGARATFKIRPVKSGAPVAAFQAAKFEDGTIIGKWEGDAAYQ
jgi:hypothetical protein